MLKSTKNVLLQEIIDGGFDLARFEREEHEHVNGLGSEFIIKLKGTPLKFHLLSNPADHRRYQCMYSMFTPDYRYNRAYFPHYDAYSDDLGEMCGELREWLDNHVADYLAEESLDDLWDVVGNERVLFGGSGVGPAETARFTDDEKLRVKALVADFEHRIHGTFMPNVEQAAEIAAQLKYLVEAMDRLNHFDWRSLLLSTVIGISTTLSLDTETGRQLFEIAKQIFAGALKYLPG